MKSAWGLAAAALSLVLILFLWLPLLDGLATTQRLAPKECTPGIDVPVVGTVGDYPDAVHRHVVNIRADGRIAVEGRTPSTYGELRQALAELAARSQGEIMRGTKRHLSGESFVIRADRAAPWRDTFAAYVACAEASADQIYFAVRHDADGAEGALAAFLPSDFCRQCYGEWTLHRIAIAPGDGAALPAAAYAEVVATATECDGRLAVSVAADGGVETGSVILWLDAALRGGAPLNGLECDERLPRAEDAIPARGDAPTSRVGVTWCDDDSLAGPGRALGAAPPMPPVARVRGVAAGQARSFRPVHAATETDHAAASPR